MITSKHEEPENSTAMQMTGQITCQSILFLEESLEAIKLPGRQRHALAVRLTALTLAALAFNTGAALAEPDGKKIFMKTCAGCHNGGRNVIDPKHPIIGSKKLSALDTFKNYLSKPHKPMPPFPKIAENDSDLKALYEYCKTLK